MKWEKFEAGYAMPVKSWCENCEDGAVQQAVNLARHPALVHHVALMPDAHQGYGMPIGPWLGAGLDMFRKAAFRRGGVVDFLWQRLGKRSQPQVRLLTSVSGGEVKHGVARRCRELADG